MTRMDEYTFLATDLLTGNVISDIELHSFYWDEIYNRPGSGLATARFDVPTTTVENFKDWTNGLWAVKGGVIKWGGIIGKTQRRGGTHVLSVPVIGFFEYFRNRILRDDQGMTYGQLLRVSDIEWRNIEQFHIFKDCIDHAQSFVDGNIHVGVEWDQLSEQQVTMIYRTFTVKYLGIALQQLAARSTGFDFRQVYYWDGNNPRCNFKLEYPARSSDPEHVLLYEPERQVTTTKTLLRALDIPGDTNFATTENLTGPTGSTVITGQLDHTWRPASTETIRSKWELPNNKSYKFSLLPSGQLLWEWTEDGTTEQSETSVSPIPDTGALKVVQVIFLADDGNNNYQIQFRYSLDSGVTWTSLNPDPHEVTFGATY